MFKKTILFIFFPFLMLSQEVYRNMPLIILIGSERETLPSFFKTQSAGAITISLEAALMQAVAPVIVSAQLMETFMSLRTMATDFLKLSVKELTAKYGNIDIFKEIKIEEFKSDLSNMVSISALGGVTKPKNMKFESLLEHVVMALITPFDVKKWEIRNLNNKFYLLIPKKISKLANLNLGLNLDRYMTINNSFFNNFFKIETFKDVSQDFIPMINKVFIQLKVYKKDKVFDIPVWNIYLGGHGGLTRSRWEIGTIAGLRVPIYSDFLKFLNSKIKTRFLFVSSCYAAGTNLKAPYESSGEQMSLNYVVVSGAITEEVINSKYSLLHFIRAQKYPSYLILNFNKFFEILLSERIVNKKYLFNPFYEAIAYVSGLLDSKGQPVSEEEYGPLINNRAWIRVPGTTWFSFINFDKEIVILNKFLNEKYKVEKISDLLEISKKRAILLDINEINMPLRIKKFDKILPAIISIVPGDTIHSFESEISVWASLSNFVKSVLRQSGLETFNPMNVSKTFYFKNISCLESEKIVKYYQNLMIVKYKTVSNKQYHQMYISLKDGNYYFAQWDITSQLINLQDLRKITSKEWDSVYAQFVAQQKNIKKSGELSAKELTAKFEAAHSGAKAAKERAKIIKDYLDYEKQHGKAGAEKWLSEKPQNLQNFLKSWLASQVGDSGAVEDLLQLQSSLGLLGSIKN